MDKKVIFPPAFLDTAYKSAVSKGYLYLLDTRTSSKIDLAYININQWQSTLDSYSSFNQGQNDSIRQYLANKIISEIEGIKIEDKSLSQHLDQSTLEDANRLSKISRYASATAVVDLVLLTFSVLLYLNKDNLRFRG